MDLDLGNHSRDRKRRARFEAFEERLALSAQSVLDGAVDSLFDRQLEHHYGELSLPTSGVGDFQLEELDGDVFHHDFDISPQLNDAHALTGVNNVYSAYGFTGKGQTVAIIDSGIAYDHLALGAGFGTGHRVVGGWDFAENDANPYDDGPAGFHGTHVAGIVGSSDASYRGVAPGADLVALRVFDDNGAGYFSWTEQALRWVHQHRNDFANPITTVNLSLGATWNSDAPPSWAMLEDEFAQLENDGIFISVSAGNSFTSYNTAGLSYPAASPYVVPVASVDNSGSLSYFSQRNSRVIAAPGRSIMSTVPDFVTGSDGNPNDYASASGTSMASPYVAGAAAVVRQAMQFVGYSGITQDTIYNHLRSTADTVYDSVTRANYSRLHLQRAIDTLMPADDYGSTSATAHQLGSLSGSQSIAGLIGSTSDVDYFTFTAGTTGTATFRATVTHDLTLNAQRVGGSGSFANNVLTFGVVAGQTYTLSLGTTSGIGRYQVAAQIEGTVPTAPGSFQGQGISPTQIQLTWTDATGETDYWVYQWKNGRSEYLDSVAANSTSYIVNGLNPGESHHFYLVAHNATGITGSGWQNNVMTLPSAAGSLQVTAVSATSVDLTWTDAIGESDYWIYQWKNGRSEYISGLSANTTSFRVDGLTAGQEHHFYVVAHNAAGITGSGWQSAVTTPTAAGSLQVTPTSATSVVLSWTDSVGESDYWIYQWKNGRSEYIAGLSANTTSYAVNGLATGQTHHFYVVAHNAHGITGSGWQNVTFSAPSAPSSLQATAVSTSSVVVSWADSSGESEYWVYQWKNGRSEYLNRIAANSTAYCVDGLSANQTHFFYVVAYNVVGTTGSGWQSAATYAASPSPTFSTADHFVELGAASVKLFQPRFVHPDAASAVGDRDLCDPATRVSYDTLTVGENLLSRLPIQARSEVLSDCASELERSTHMERGLASCVRHERDLDAVDEIFFGELFNE